MSELITEDLPRIKFSLERKGEFRLLTLSEELKALAELMALMEEMGACPVLDDGKVGGNCAVRYTHAYEDTVEELQAGDLLISRSGKSAKVMMTHHDFVLVNSFERAAWTASFRSEGADVKPSSDTPLLWSALSRGTSDVYGWRGSVPTVAIHGHALAAGEGLTYAEKKQIPISERETLFSTPEDLYELEQILIKYPYPEHRIWVRKGHGFFILGQSVEDVKATLEELVCPFLRVH